MSDQATAAEARRLEALASYGILDTAEEADFNDVAELAAHICGTPISLVTLVDEHRQWFKAHPGLDFRETPREMSFCSHAIEQEGVMIVPDAAEDARFRENPLVTGDPHMRFYAGAPLTSSLGERLGTLCVIDREPRRLRPDQRKALEALSRQVSALFELRLFKQQAEDSLHAADTPEDGLRQAWSTVDVLVRKIREVLFLLDSSSERITYISPSFDLLWGRSRDAFLGQPAQSLRDAVHPEDRARILPLGDAVGETLEYRVQSAQGVVRWVSQEAFKVTTAEGTEQITMIAKDITDEVLTRLAYAESEERFRLLVESVEEYSIYMLDPEGHVASWNKGAQRIKGYEPDEIIGQHFSIFYTDEDREAGVPERVLKRAAEQGQSQRENWHVRKGGERFRANVVLTRLTDEKGRLRGFAKVTRDLTERLRAEEEQARLRDQALQAQKLEVVGRLAGGIAHDFNNLLAVVSGAAELIQERPDDVDAVREEASEIVSTVQRGAKLVRQLLTISRPSTQHPDPLDLNAVIRATEELLKRTVGTGIAIETELAEGLPPVLLDVTHAEQIILNLAVNARDAMSGMGRLVISTEALQHEHGSQVRLNVADTGPGIDREVVEHIFEPFFTTKRAGGGTGLGLSTVYALVVAAGGRIAAANGPEGGAVFEIVLPALAPDNAGSDESRGPLAGLTILLVDDEDALRRIVGKRLLQGGAASVIDDASPVAALQRVEAGLRPDLLVADIVMPDLNGTQLAEKVLELSPDTRALFISGYAHEELQQRAEEMGSFLPKPFTPAELIRAAAYASGASSERRR